MIPSGTGEAGVLAMTRSLTIDGEDGRRSLRVVEFSTNGSSHLAAHNEGGSLKQRNAVPV